MERADESKVQYKTKMIFPDRPSNITFRIEGDNRAIIDDITLMTLGELLEDGFSIEQNLSLIVNRSRCVSYKNDRYYENPESLAKARTHSSRVSSFTRFVYRKHYAIIREITAAYKSSKKLPRKIGQLEMIEV